MCMRPMLARIGSRRDLDREGFLFEPKMDGIRATCSVDGTVRVFNRSCRDVSSRYPEFDFGDALHAESCILDGEIVLYGQGGNPDFTALMQRHLGTGRIRGRDRAIRYAVFDILRKDGRDLTALKLTQRKEILRQTLGEHPHLEFVVYTPDSHKLWDFIQQRALEGIIAKKADSDYRPGERTRNWLKIKAFETIDAIIVGYTEEKRAVSALALAVYHRGELRFVGKVGTGMNSEDIRVLRDLLDPIKRIDPPLKVPAGYAGIQWVEPRYVCEVRYLEFGSQGMLRNPSFLRLRPDKSPEECRLDAQKK